MDTLVVVTMTLYDYERSKRILETYERGVIKARQAYRASNNVDRSSKVYGKIEKPVEMKVNRYTDLEGNPKDEIEPKPKSNRVVEPKATVKLLDEDEENEYIESGMNEELILPTST